MLSEDDGTNANRLGLFQYATIWLRDCTGDLSVPVSNRDRAHRHKSCGVEEQDCSSPIYMG